MIGLACLAGLVLCGSGGSAQIPGALPELVRLEPGADVAQGPPAGWTHRVVRSVPRLASGELASLPKSAAATATRFRTVIAAEVVADPQGRARLDRVGLGNAISVGDRELAVTPEGPTEVLRSLGAVDWIVLMAAQATLDRGRLAARTPTFALVRSPTVLVVDSEHRDAELCYALLVDPGSGALATFCWPLPGDGESTPEAVSLLEPGLSFTAPIDVRIGRRIGPVIISWSFALGSPPPGRRVAVPAPLSGMLALPEGSRIDPEAMERGLRSLLSRSR